jgi:hypothetical protein|tara:strand:+ start:116 stop:355 length:240 start_codon:yes stop_codon:yes gene_type:complete
MFKVGDMITVRTNHNRKMQNILGFVTRVFPRQLGAITVTYLTPVSRGRVLRPSENFFSPYSSIKLVSSTESKTQEELDV